MWGDADNVDTSASSEDGCRSVAAECDMLPAKGVVEARISIEGVMAVAGQLESPRNKNRRLAMLSVCGCVHPCMQAVSCSLPSPIQYEYN